MRLRMRFFSVLLWLIPAICWAGEPVSPNIPTLGEYGLIALGVGVVGAGIAVLRGRKRR